MSDIAKFNFEGLDESALGYHPEHGAIVHKTKFIAWLGLDTANASRIEDRHLGPNDVVKGVFSPIGGKARGGRKADALTKRGVRRLLFRSDKPIAVEYADRVLDMLDELDRTGLVVDEARITDDQIDQGQKRLAHIARGRLEERSDYKSILQSLKLGGAVADEYRFVQNTLYLSLFGKTAAQIRTGVQQSGVERKDGKGLVKSTVAKDFLTPPQLALLNSTVLATAAQIDLHYPEGATAAQMIDAIHRAISIVKRPLSGGAA